jgi:hypothetical protein
MTTEATFRTYATSSRAANCDTIAQDPRREVAQRVTWSRGRGREAVVASNYERLKTEGLILNECPDPHKEVLNNLSEEEMEVILKVKARLDEADAAVGWERPAPFTNCVAF